MYTYEKKEKKKEKKKNNKSKTLLCGHLIQAI